MADIRNTMKSALIKGMEAIGSAATTIATSTRSKVNEMNLVNRRQEILSDFGARAYAEWQKGEKFPAELEALLVELNQVDEELNVLRAERLSDVKLERETAAEEAEVSAEEAAEPADEEQEPVEEADPEPEAETEEPEATVPQKETYTVD